MTDPDFEKYHRDKKAREDFGLKSEIERGRTKRIRLIYSTGCDMDWCSLCKTWLNFGGQCACKPDDYTETQTKNVTLTAMREISQPSIPPG